jgi:glycosyltransferase involved in cell wall biosynthesis
MIPLGFDLDRFHAAIENKKEIRTRLKINKETIAVGIVGRLAPVKNHKLFLDAVEIVLEKTAKRVQVFIVGNGELFDEINEQANQINHLYPDSIVMTDWIHKIEAFNPGMDIICLSSDNEGTPVSLIEAQASNIPVLSTNVGGVQDILIDEGTGLIVPKGNVTLYAEKLLLMVENENIRQKLSQNGWNHVQEKFHYRTLAKNMENYYNELLSK